MRTAKIEVKVFQYDELSEEAKANAKNLHALSNGYTHEMEAEAALEAFVNYFDCMVKQSSYNFTDPDCSPWLHVSESDMDETEIRRRMDSLGDAESLSGYSHDESLVNGFRNAWEGGERNLCKLIEAAFASWMAYCWEDHQSFYADEGHFASMMEGYEFHEDGRFFRGTIL